MAIDLNSLRVTNPTAYMLAKMPPKSVAGLYLDAVDAYEWIKSEDSKGMARAAMGETLAELEVAIEAVGLSYSDIEADAHGRPTGDKLEAKQNEWFEHYRG